MGDLLFTPYRAVIASYPVWFYVLNRGARARFNADKKELTPVQERVVRDLRTTGIGITSCDELFGPGTFEKLKAYAETSPTFEKEGGKKPYIIEYWAPTPTLSKENPFVTLSLSPAALNIVNAYMQMWSKFYYVMLGRTLVVPVDAEAKASQRWHRDYEETRMCKMFIYLNDVDEDSGPFTYVKGSQLGGKYRKIFPQRPGRGIYPPEGGVEALIPERDRFLAVGRAGSVIFADTSGLHRGGFAKKHERFMFTAGYCSSAAFGRKRYYLPAAGDTLMDGASPAAEFALRGLPYKG